MSEQKKAPKRSGMFGDERNGKGASNTNHDTPGSVNQEHAGREHRKPMRDPDIIRFWGVPSNE